MAIVSLTVPNGHTPLDYLLYRAFGAEIPGLLESVYRLNEPLAAYGLFPPAGTVVQVDTAAAQPPAPGPQQIVRLYD